MLTLFALGSTIVIGGYHLPAVSAQATTVEIEVLAEPQVPGTLQHAWLNVLQNANFARVRIRTVESIATPSLERRSDGSIHVTAILRRQDELQLPGLNVTRQQSSRLADWVASLSAPRTANAGERPLAFGLTADQLVKVRDALSKRLDATTRGKQVLDLMPTIRQCAGLPIQVSRGADNALRQDDPFPDELQGVSVGTALAALLRPRGLAVTPRRRQGKLELVLQEFADADEFWPVGWPIDQPGQQVAPRLYEFLPVDINDVPLTAALDAISARIDMPLLFDQNGMARHDIVLETARVTLEPTRTFYKRALDRVLYAARLKSEIRVDDAGKPFLWIAPHLGAPARNSNPTQ